MTNYGLLVLVAACKVWAVPGGKCPSDLLLRKVNRWLDESHKLNQADLNAICLELEQHTGSSSLRVIVRPDSDDDKQRDDNNFEEAVKNAFNSFREQERNILLNVPGESRPEIGDEHIDSYILSTRNEKWWWGAAHMRHHLEFLLVLKGLKPCVLLGRHTINHAAIFSTVVLDSLVPIMDRLGLWSYGFRLGFREGEWVLYDARSPKRSQVEKIFFTPNFVRELDQTGAFPAKDKMYYVPNLEVAHALGYPILSDAIQPDSEPSWIQIRDVTEMDELERLGRPPPFCCVQGMIYCCPDAGAAGEADWKEVLAHFHRAQGAQYVAEEESWLAVWTLEWDCIQRASVVLTHGDEGWGMLTWILDDDLDSEDDDLEDDDEDSEDEHPDVEGYDMD